MPPVFVFVVVFNVGSGDLNLGYHACKVGILPTETHYPSLTRLQPLLSDMNKIRVNGAGKMAALRGRILGLERNKNKTHTVVDFTPCLRQDFPFPLSFPVSKMEMIVKTAPPPMGDTQPPTRPPPPQPSTPSLHHVPKPTHPSPPSKVMTMVAPLIAGN